VTFANIVRGVPIDGEKEFTGSLLDPLNPYALLGGFTFLLVCLAHGAIFLTLKTRGELLERARRAARVLTPASAAAVVGFVAWTLAHSADVGRIGVSVLVAAIGAGALAHALVQTLRRRRRDLAILKTLGFRRGQVRTAVAWQASTIVLIALAIGLPIGIMLGRVLWTTFADGLGVIAVPRVPIVVVWLAVLAGLALANMIAAPPAGNAARTSPALVLRTE
jgi:cytochrome d ubiquinol oxidase subunit II